MKRFLKLIAAISCGAILMLASAAQAARDLTFFQVSDTHYGKSPVGDKTVPMLVDKMNALPGTPYPAIIGGKVGAPRGVIHTGDITNDGKKEQWLMFVRDYGLTGKDGRLAWPVYETIGNHDGSAGLPVRNGIRERNKSRIGLTAVSDSGLLYSWDWDGIHFVSCGISVGTTASKYDPEHSFEFLEKDLKQSIGTSGRPVIVLHHFGFDKHADGWWSDEWRANYFALIKDINVIGILHGHSHDTSIYEWNQIDVYHPPHFKQDGPKDTAPVTHGFFVFHITDDELSVAERKLDDTWGMTAKKKFKPAPAK